MDERLIRATPHAWPGHLFRCSFIPWRETYGVAMPCPQRLTFLVAAIVACLGMSTATADALTHAGIYAQQARRATNRVRVSNNLAKLGKNDCRQQYAVRQAKAMAASRQMYHQDLLAIMTGCKLAAAGENVAYGFPNGGSVNNGWMNSVPHRANILNPVFQRMGIGARVATETGT